MPDKNDSIKAVIATIGEWADEPTGLERQDVDELLAAATRLSEQFGIENFLTTGDDDDFIVEEASPNRSG